MKKPNNIYLDPATARHLSSDSKWLTACLTITGIVVVPLLGVYWLFGPKGVLIAAGSALFYVIGCYVEQAPVSSLFLW